MTKRLLTLLLTITLFTTIAFAQKSYDFNVDGIYYNITCTNPATVETTSGYGDWAPDNWGSYSMSVTIPSTVTYKGVTYSVTSIGNRTFKSSFLLTSVTIPNTVTSIGDYAFFECDSLKSVNIPNSVTSIGHYAFGGCYQANVIIPIQNSITYIGARALEDTSWFYNLPDGLVYIGKVAYKYKGTMPTGTSISIKDGTKQITGYCFKECTDLTSIAIPNSVTSIGVCAFSGCRCLTSIVIPNSVTEIGGSAFSGCIGLTNVTIPNSVTSIGSNAFDGCSNLMSITVPNSVTSIGSNAFDGTNWYNNQPNDRLVYAGKVAYKYKGTMPAGTSINIKDGTKGIAGDCFNGYTDLTSITIPNSVIEIGSWAFANCSGLTNVTIPNSVTSIGSWTFYKCSGLTNVAIPNSVTSIGSNAFRLCSSLTSVTIGNSVTSIGSNAFEDCKYLTSITIGNSVTSIDACAFYGCYALKDIYSHIKNPKKVKMAYWYYGPYEFNGVFTGVPKNKCTLHVPRGTLELYRSCDQWKNFVNIIDDIEVTTAVTGDVDGNGMVDVDDVNAMINLILNFDQYKDKYPGSADLDSNGMVDVDDVNALINIILSK